MEVMDEGRISWKKGMGLVGRSVLITPHSDTMHRDVYQKGGNGSTPDEVMSR